MSFIQAYWHREFMKLSVHEHVIPPVVCRDGFRMSVQASRYHYSMPKGETRKSGNYTHWEIGFPSRWDERLAPYGDKEEDEVFGYVPTAVVDAIIAAHGGLETKE